MHARRRASGRRRAAIGLALVAVVWTLNWSASGLRTHLLFFPLWLGYVLAVDGWTAARTGTSILARSRKGFAALFAASVPVWWIFELVNRHLRNWEYVGREHFGDLEYALLCSIAFSTVMPAVLTTAELMRSFRWIERFSAGPVVRPSPGLTVALAVSGGLMLAAMLAWPRRAYPLLWVSGVPILEAACTVLGRPSLTSWLRRGDWRPWMALWSGVLVCAFFWEMWNARSYPKWIYHVPGVEFAHLFEMPLLGYLGYLPFALEVYLFGQLLVPGRADPRL